MKISFDNIVCKETFPNGSGKVVIDGLSAIWELKEDEKVLCVITDNTVKTEKLFKCIAGLEKAGSGDINISPENIAVAYIPKESSLLDWYTTEENIGFPLKIKGLSKNRIEEVVKPAVEVTGLEGYEQHLQHPKSRGYSLRVEIARALASGANLILINDSVSAVRVSLREDLYQLIRKISDEKEVSFIISSSDLKGSYGLPSVVL